tara:strand:- start:77 stop:565 length:489 start_codon:yes stop_codon:yes gene_type:complete
MAFYVILMLALIIYSQGLMGNSQSDTPIYIGVVILIGFPFFMKYIFLQECSLDARSDNLQDGYLNDNGDLSEINNDTQGASTNTGLSNSNKDDTDARFNIRSTLLCTVEKYGGFQTMLCASLIIMIITRTHQRSDKAIAFGIMILLTYGLSQTFIRSQAYVP